MRPGVWKITSHHLVILSVNVHQVHIFSSAAQVALNIVCIQSDYSRLCSVTLLPYIKPHLSQQNSIVLMKSYLKIEKLGIKRVISLNGDWLVKLLFQRERKLSCFVFISTHTRTLKNAADPIKTTAEVKSQQSPWQLSKPSPDENHIVWLNAVEKASSLRLFEQRLDLSDYDKSIWLL